uniref:Holin n=1 Tax=Siphoviridae sp. ctKcB20 TaxID=2827568 RepID=A0A8S5LLQ3_9CAUD|nr:MAG TPA: holin [Siphoviridae sp. ctKcB20]
MSTEQIVSIIVAVLAGLATCIPLALKLVQYVKKATQEKNWATLLDLVMKLIAQAEEKFKDGATRKEWVMAMVQTSAEYISYPLDTQALSEMIDELVKLTNKVNVDKK